MILSRLQTTMKTFRTGGESKLLTSNLDVSELISGWRTLFGAVVAMAVGVSALPYYTAGLFLAPLQAEFGWTRAQISFGPSLFLMGLVATAPVLGMVIDRYGARQILAPGIFMVAVFFLGFSFLSASLIHYYALFFGMSVLACGSGSTPLTRIVAAAFDKSRGAALGGVLAAIGLVGVVAPIVLAPFIEEHGWRNGYRMLAATALIALPIAMWALGAKDPQPKNDSQTHKPAGVAFNDAVRRPVFWMLCAAFFLAAFGSAGLIVNLPPLLADRGLSSGTATKIVAGVGFSIIFSRLIVGVLVDRYFAPKVASIVMAVAGAMFIVFALSAIPQLAYFGVIGIGLAFGAEMDLIGYCVSRYFGFRAYGKIYGIVYGVTLCGAALSPLAYGLCFDLYGDYKNMLVGSGVLLFTASLLFSLMPKFKDVMEAAAGRERRRPEPLVGFGAGELANLRETEKEVRGAEN